MNSTASHPRCPIHHTSVDRCPPPELADALDTLRTLTINPTLVPADTLRLDQCGGCQDSRDWLPETAVARVTYSARSNGARYHEDACPLCLGPIVTFHRRYGFAVEVALPVPAATFGLVSA